MLGVRCFTLCTLAVLIASYGLECVNGKYYVPTHIELSSRGKPLVKPQSDRQFTTLLSVDGGGLRAIIATVILAETEREIKLYLLEHPELLPRGVHIESIDDFDINLADYFDCMTGTSTGSWITAYLASRGGQGADRVVLDDPAIVAEYGVIPSGSVEAIRVMVKEFASVIYPVQTLNVNAGRPFDFTNLAAPGVAAPLFPTTGLEETLEAFLGDATLADCDTTFLVPTAELATQIAIFFIKNNLGDEPVTASARLQSRTSPRSVSATRHVPDFMLDSGKDYYLTDVVVASSAFVPVNPAKNVSQVGSVAVEFTLVDGIYGVDNPTFPAAFFVAAETGDFNFERIAILSVGTGGTETDLSALANAGALQWASVLPTLLITSGTNTLNSLLDYVYYANPNMLPNQYLRIETPASEVPRGDGLPPAFDPSLVDVLEQVGMQTTEEFSPAIRDFVTDFIFA